MITLPSSSLRNENRWDTLEQFSIFTSLTIAMQKLLSSIQSSSVLVSREIWVLITGEEEGLRYSPVPEDSSMWVSTKQSIQAATGSLKSATD